MRPEQAAGTRSHQMTRYLISFDAHAMDHIPDEDMPAVAQASHEVVQKKSGSSCPTRRSGTDPAR
jgi:hypothetical protein